MVDDGGRGRYPTWVRAVLVGLQVLGIAAGLVVGTMTYEAWSDPDDPEPTTTTTVVTPEAPVPEATLG